MIKTARFIDVHVLQTVPFSNLNRDDTDSVKNVTYGDALRTRVSSQCWKRAVREDFQERIGDAALRTRRIAPRVAHYLETERGWPRALAARAGAHLAVAALAKFEVATETGADGKKPTVPNLVITNAMLYLPETAVAALADIAEASREQLETAKDITKPSDKSILDKGAVEAVVRGRNAIINLFGRMLAEVDNAGVDGAVQVAHAFTTHETAIENDYFSAVDDVTALWNDTTGSAHMGTAEFSTGTFYRYATLDLRELLANIGPDPVAARELTEAFVSSFILSLPRAKKNSTAAHTVPDLVHLTVRRDRPLSYAAAFEKPIRSGANGGYAEASRNGLAEYARAVTKLLGSGPIMSGWASLEDKDLDGIGTRFDSFPDLIDNALTSSFEARQ